MRGGSEKYCFALSEALKDSGDETVFFAMKDEKNFPCSQEEFFIDNAGTSGGLKSKLKLVFNMAYNKQAYKKLYALLKKENPDFAVLNLIHKQITCSVIDAIRDYGKETGRYIPIFWACHDYIFVCPSYLFLDGKGEICEKCLSGDYRNCVKNNCVKGSRALSFLSYKDAVNIKKHGWYDKVDAYICPSEFILGKLKEGGFTKSELVKITNLMPQSDFSEEYKGKRGTYFLYFGRLSKEKGVDTLIKAFGESGINDAELIIAGRGPCEEELRDLAENYDKKISFCGYKSGRELKQIIGNASFAVMSSEWYENCPYGILEAKALGKPVICSKIGGMKELVTDGEDGFLFASEEELKEKLNKAVNISDEEYEKMSEKAYLDAKTRCDGKKYVRKIKEIYERVKKLKAENGGVNV